MQVIGIDIKVFKWLCIAAILHIVLSLLTIVGILSIPSWILMSPVWLSYVGNLGVLFFIWRSYIRHEKKFIK